MTRSGENSVDIGITIFWNAHRYSASPIPFVGHGMLTELSPVSKPWVTRKSGNRTDYPKPCPSPRDFMFPNFPLG